MRAKSLGSKAPAERVVKDIRRATRKHHSAEDKIRIVVDGLRGEDSIAELEEIARREGRGERHIRLLAPLAFVSPHTVRSIINGNASADITVTGFAQRVADLWEDQNLAVE